MAGNAAHQGVVAVTSAKQYSDLDDVVGAKRGQYSLVIVLDGVEDPHNLGALMRTADAAGADGVVIPERRAAAVTGTVTKTSAGASEHLPIAKVTNIARTVEELKERNIWTVGLDERGKQTYDALDYNMDCALVLGAEGKGLHDLVKKKCDFLVSIPMLGKVPSLNVSVAGAVVMYEIVRQRRAQRAQEQRGVRGCEMKLRSLRLVLLCVLCASAVNAFSLDREAFTFTNYDLNVRVEPEQQRLGVRGKITLRNDSPTPQKIAVLQISSSLDWRSIKAGDKQLQFVSQPYTSDIDHTGALSEAIVTLPEAVAPKGTVELEIAYEGVIVLDATRLTRIGTPEDAGEQYRLGPDQYEIHRGARSGIRGVVSDRDRSSESLGRQEPVRSFGPMEGARSEPPTHAFAGRGAEMTKTKPPDLLVNATSCSGRRTRVEHQFRCRLHVPIAGTCRPDVCDCQLRDRGSGGDRSSFPTRPRRIAATTYADAAEKVIPFITEWFGAPRQKRKLPTSPIRMRLRLRAALCC